MNQEQLRLKTEAYVFFLGCAAILERFEEGNREDVVGIAEMVARVAEVRGWYAEVCEYVLTSV